MKELYNEYCHTAALLEQRWKELRQMRSQVRGEQALLLERRIACLDAEIGEVREVLDQLVRYIFP